MIFRSEGLKYHDIIVRKSNNRAGNIFEKGSPAAILEMTAPVMAKKNPAYAHSFSNGNFGISIAIIGVAQKPEDAFVSCVLGI